MPARPSGSMLSAWSGVNGAHGPSCAPFAGKTVRMPNGRQSQLAGYGKLALCGA